MAEEEVNWFKRLTGAKVVSNLVAMKAKKAIDNKQATLKKSLDSEDTHTYEADVTTENGKVFTARVSPTELACTCSVGGRQTCYHVVACAVMSGDEEVLSAMLEGKQELKPLVLDKLEPEESEVQEIEGVIDEIGEPRFKYGRHKAIVVINGTKLWIEGDSREEVENKIRSLHIGDRIKTQYANKSKSGTYNVVTSPIVVVEPAKREVKQEAEPPVNILKAGGQELAQIIKADDLDEEMMIKEYLEGTEPYVYQMEVYEKNSNGKVEKRIKYTLSWAGMAEAMRRYGNLHVIEWGIQVLPSGKEMGYAKVRDVSRNIEMVGTAVRYTNIEHKENTLISKAVRNALRRLIPKSIQDTVVEEALKAKSVIVL